MPTHALRILIAGLAIALSARPGEAAPTAEQRCLGGKRKAAATKLAAKLACTASAVRAAAAVDPACLLRAEGRFTAAFSTAGDCLGDATEVEGIVDGCVATLVGDVPGTGRCPGAKLRAVGKGAKRQLRCLATDALHAGALVPCHDRAASHLARALTKAGSCPASASIQADLDACQGQIAAATPLHADTTTTTSTTTSSSTTTSTTPAPVCGNGVVEGSEECDIVPNATCESIGAEACVSAGGPGECTCCTLGQCLTQGVPTPCCPGYTCIQWSVPQQPGFCQKQCTQPADCPPTESCINGICEPFRPCSQPTDCTAPTMCLSCSGLCTPAVTFCCAPPGAPCPAPGSGDNCCFSDPARGINACNSGTHTCM